MARTAHGLTPAIDRGLLVGSEPAGEAARRWHIELGGRRRLRLRILPAGVASHRPQLALLRESRTYDFSLRGVEVSAQWRIQVHNEPLQQVTVLLDPGLQLISARYGDAPIPWSAAPSANGEAARVVLTLPEPIRDAERVHSPQRAGPAARRSTLAAAADPRRGPLLAGREHHAVDVGTAGGRPHCAAGLRADGRRTAFGAPGRRVAAIPGVRAGCHGRTVAGSRGAPTLQVLSATAVELGGEEVTARMAADFRATERRDSRWRPTSRGRGSSTPSNRRPRARWPTGRSSRRPAAANGWRSG